jgi:hypothetical protein
MKWSALALVVLAALPVACGGSSLVAPSLAEAATKSSNAERMKFDMSMAMTTPQLTQPLTMTANGTADNAHHRMQMSIDMSKLAESVAGSAATSPADWQGKEVGVLSNGGFVVYMSLPVLTKLIRGAKPWLKMNLNEAVKKAGIDLSQFTNLTANPAQVLDWLRATSGTITKVGSEKVDGVQTTHYHATIDLRKYPKLVPPARRAAMKRAVHAMARVAHVTTFPADAWVGSDGLVRKMRVELHETVRGQRVGITSTVRFHDFGGPVTITLPPATETVDVSKLVGGQTQ